MRKDFLTRPHDWLRTQRTAQPPLAPLPASPSYTSDRLVALGLAFVAGFLTAGLLFGAL